MPASEYPFVLGTAGHIDHGKTAVVKALSGVDCDRLSEEKKRGMTIELGFAPLTLPSGKTISIVDVPGHEKFIRQMVAGAAGIDAVMLVVAADDGVMPQTREHLEILTLLGIKNGLTVINKIDVVDGEMLEMARDDVLSLISGTFLEGRPIMPVSALTGEGITELTAAIQAMVDGSVQRSRDGAFFLPVDRAFHISGFGTVITGTALNGTLSEGDDVDVLPAGAVSKVRSIQVHGESVQKACAGQRVAVNISGVSLDDVKRGDVIAAKGRFAPTECVDVCVEALSSFAEPIEHWQRLRLHVGTSDVLARISLLDREKILPGETSVAQLLPEEPITAARDAHFILRLYSPLRTIAGGRVIVPCGARPKNRAAKDSLVKMLTSMSTGAEEKEWLLALLEYKGMLGWHDLLMMSGLEPKSLDRCIMSLDAKGRIGTLKAGEVTVLSSRKIEEFNASLGSELEKFHKAHPERRGMDMDEVSRCLALPDMKFVRELVKLLKRSSTIALDEDRVKLRDFEPFDEARFMSNVIALKELARKSAYAMPTVEEAMEKLQITQKEMNRVLTYLKERRDLTLIGGGFILISELEADFRDKLTAINGDITLAGVRDLTGSSRKYALPLLEYFDSKGVTRRVGDKRLLIKR